ncbi:MAG: hypothetical protein L0Y35_01735 [Flammeovirgaceae bacterium]|nr:hypothetical protein [Flammeovirgaceae bacterium]
MRPREKGWLKEYLEFRGGMLRELTSKTSHKTAHPEHSIYRVVQPTGLMYGQAVGEINHPDQSSWDDKDRMKVLLAESLVSSSLLFHEKAITNPEEFSKVIFKTLENVSNFYNNIFPELATPSKTLFGRKKSPLELAEKILDKRIEQTGNRQDNFWNSFFHNSLLFLDVFIFGQWIHTNADKIVADFFRYEREELRFSVVKVITSAAHANKRVEYEERRLFEYFIQSTDLPADKRKEALRIFDQGLSIEEINLPAENSWILKKFFLEIAILTTWADRKVEEAEQDYIKRFCYYLNFNDDDLENSLIAIEGFVLEHWNQLDHLQNKKDYNEVSDQFVQRVQRIAEKNKSKLAKEIQESEDVLELLRKARTNPLTEEEKEKMRSELITILRTIPTFVITSLPQKFLTLPMLLKILPKNLFENNN